MKVCPQCQREYEDTRKVCFHDGTPLQTQTDAPEVQGLSPLAQEVEQQRREAERTVLRGFSLIVGLLLVIAIGAYWYGAQSHSSVSQTQTTVATSEQPSPVPPPPVTPASPATQTGGDPGEVEGSPAVAAPADVVAEPAPAQAESEEEKVAQKRDAVPPETAQEPEAAATEPEQMATAEKSETATEPEQMATAEKSETAPEPEQKAIAEESVIEPGREQSVTAQKSVRSASPGRESRRRLRAEGRQQAQSAPSDQSHTARGRGEREELRPPMVWIYQTKTSTPLLSRAGTSALVIRQLKPGEQLRVVGAVGNYLEVRSSEEDASPTYVHPQDVTLVRIE